MELYKDPQWLKLYYCDKKMDREDIAKIANTSSSQIYRYVRRFGLSRPKIRDAEAQAKAHTTMLAKTTYSGHGVISSPISFDYRDKSWLIQKYQVEKISALELSRLCGVSHCTIIKWMTKLGVPRREKMNYGEKNGRFKGNRAYRAGYTFIRLPQHPQANQGGYVREHRFVMEKHVGHYLTSNDVVHHKDGDKKNNKINNLELFTNSEHKIYEQTLQLFIKKILHSDDPHFFVSYREDLSFRFQDFLSKSR